LAHPKLVPLPAIVRVPAAFKKALRQLHQDTSLPENLRYQLLRKRELENLFGKFSDLKELTKAVLNLKIFQGHHSCQIIVQTKGLARGEVYRHERPDLANYYAITSKDFGELFLAIKKSKYKLFYHEQFKLFANLRGTFFAKELNLRKHHVILMISRHDFLPPTTHEQAFFGHMALLLGPVIENLLAVQRQKARQQMAMAVLEIFPAPLTIKAGKNLSFTNAAGRKSPPTPSANYLLHQSPTQVLKIGLDHQQDLAPDIYHFQRIQLLGELLDTLHHELCNPLFGIKLWAEIMAQELTSTQPSGPDDNRDFLQEISRHALRCQNIIENFSVLYNDTQQASWIDLQVLLPEIMLLIKSAGRQIKKEIIFTPTTPKSLWFKTNPTWLTQILFNLLINSTQALNEAHVEHPQIILEVFHQAEDKMIFAIKDNGRGIPPEILPHIFLPFFTTKPNGTGLGLAICKNLALRLNGTISYDPSSHPGMTFLVTLPRSSQEPPPSEH